MNFRPMITTDYVNWAGNALVFATQAEALASANELASRWLLVRDVRTDPTDKPVNYRFDFEAYRSIPLRE